MTSCRSGFAKFLRFFGLFPNSTFLRYNGEPEYTTITGGVLSILILAVFIILFANMGVRTANK